MAMAWLAGLPLRSAGYQPRHRSPRWDKADLRALPDLRPLEDLRPLTDLRPARVDHQADRAFSASVPGPSNDSGDPDFLDQLTRGQIRRILESSAINDLTDTVPELVATIAHSSHTTATLASAWRDFQEATRAAHALHLAQRAWWEFYCQQDLGPCPQVAAAEIKQGQADDAWYLITNGGPELRQESLAGRTTTR
jgi:hypothetical protein